MLYDCTTEISTDRENLNLISYEEYVHLAIRRIARQGRSHQPGEAIEALAHVSGENIKEEASWSMVTSRRCD